MKLQKKVKNVVYHKLGCGLGDLILVVPVFRALKEIFPKAKITFFGPYSPQYTSMVKAIPYVDEFVLDEGAGKKSFKGFLSFWKAHFRKYDIIISGQTKFLPSLRLWLLSPKFFISRNPLFSHWKILNPKFYKKDKLHVISKMIAPIRILGYKEINYSSVIEVPEKYLSLSK